MQCSDRIVMVMYKRIESKMDEKVSCLGKRQAERTYEKDGI